MADIGDKLRSAREAKGLSIEDIEKATKIQGRYLTAIEQDEFDKLPGDFYVRAFIRQYAQVVGLDGKQLLSEYHNEIPQAEPEEYVEDSIDNKSEEVRKTTSSKKKLWKEYLPRIIVGVGIIVVILVCYVVYAHFSAGNNQSNNNSANDVSVSSDNTNKPKKQKKIKKSSVKIKELATAQYRVTGLKKNRNLVVRAGEQATNVSISINGVHQFSQVLNPNQKHTLYLPTTAQTVTVTFGNGSGTSISFGGKKVPYDTQTTGNTLTFYIGKQHRVNQSNTTNNSNSTTNNSTTGHSGTTTNQQQNQHQNSGTTSNQHTGQTNSQTGGQGGQTGQQTGQGNNNEQSGETNHSDSSSSNGTDGR